MRLSRRATDILQCNQLIELTTRYWTSQSADELGEGDVHFLVSLHLGEHFEEGETKIGLLDDISALNLGEELRYSESENFRCLGVNLDK